MLDTYFFGKWTYKQTKLKIKDKFLFLTGSYCKDGPIQQALFQQKL